MSDSSNRIYSQNMVNDALKKVEKDLAATDPKLTPEQECLNRANIRRSQAAIRFAKEYNIRVVPMKVNDFIEKLYPILRQEFKDFSKDDFATLACMLLAITAADAMRDELI